MSSTPIVFHDFRARPGDSIDPASAGPMKTAEIAAYLADAAGYFPALGALTAHDLLALVHAELGHAEILDDFQPYGAHFARAVGPRVILHVVSGPSPVVGLRSLIRGLLLGAHNLCTVPAVGAADFYEFRRLLPARLAQRIEVDRELPGSWLSRADAVIVFGSGETVESVRPHLRPDQILLTHTQKLSFGVVFEDPDFLSATGAARDASAPDHMRGLAPHVFYVAQDPLAYAARLAAEMERWQLSEPRSVRPVAEANAIRNQRVAMAARVANDEPVALFESADAAGWTVAFDATPGFPYPPVHRFVYVKPLPDDLSALLAEVQPYVACAGVWPATRENARRLAAFEVPRICPIGQMQVPPATWHRGGQQVLAPLVRWVDFEK